MIAHLQRASNTAGLLAYLWSPGERGETGTGTTVVVLAFGAVSGLLAEVSFVAVETLGAEAGRRRADRVHRTQAAQTGIDQGAVLVGPLLGGVLLLAGASVLLAVVALLAMTAAAATQAAEALHDDRHRAPSSLLTGWRTPRRTPALAWLIGGLAASNLASGVLQAAAPITVIHRFHYSTASVGAVWSAAAGASLLTVIAAWCPGACVASVAWLAGWLAGWLADDVYRSVSRKYRSANSRPRRWIRSVPTRSI
ncbi:hypothetical protein OG896_38475 [Streptomyces sp. NBC_00669]|uniref:hypothetical protein n=1 Tax=Streptomyces sp. NBC_00669 TaxID=2976011 RepID=UPI002E35B855|nr:hypothetical protein [Streptomyces sp. NBC_00669]